MIKEYLDDLSTSERYRLLIAFIFIMSLVLYLFVWSPLYERNESLKQTLTQKQQLLLWMEESAAIVSADNKPEEISDLATLQRLISSRARYHEISLSRLQTLASGKIQLQIEQVSFNKLLDFVDFLTAEGASLEQVTIKRGNVAGAVSAGLVFRGKEEGR